MGIVTRRLLFHEVVRSRLVQQTVYWWEKKRSFHLNLDSHQTWFTPLFSSAEPKKDLLKLQASLQRILIVRAMQWMLLGIVGSFGYSSGILWLIIVSCSQIGKDRHSLLSFGGKVADITCLTRVKQKSVYKVKAWSESGLDLFILLSVMNESTWTVSEDLGGLFLPLDHYDSLKLIQWTEH